MLANSNVFCNTPWYELHIYWDGSFGICCQESHKLYSGNQYNIKNMSLMEWFNSEPARQFRLSMFDSKMPTACSRCNIEEQHGGHNRRIRGNQKSVIFMSAFKPSLEQSPGFKHFEYSKNNLGYTNTHPIDLHIDLGNFCNLACKMCNSQASSMIASQNVKWGIKSDRQYLGQDWTKDNDVWNNFKKQLLEIPNLNNIHFMGGETLLLTNKLDDLIDTMIEHKRFDLCFSFVTNGTVYKPELIKKLKKFRRVGIEISIESTQEQNSYVRQGTDTAEVLKNIELYKKLCNDTSITLTLRPAPSLLTVGTHISMLEYALENKLLIKTNFCNYPEFLDIKYLPTNVKKLYKKQYQAFIDQINDTVNTNASMSDPNNYRSVIKHHALTCLDMLNTPLPKDAKLKHQQLVEHCSKWDKVYKLDARKLYPELVDIWDKYDY